jgi:hypothetical protein
MYLLKSLLNNEEKLSNDNKKLIESVIVKQIKWLESNEYAGIEALNAHKEKMEEIITPMIKQLYEDD